VKLLQQGLGSLRGAVGTPDQVADLVARYEAAGVDQVIFVLQAGKNRHEHICESIELFGREVLPRFSGEADEREREKCERLAEACAAALARREPARVLEPGSYVIEPQDEPRPAYATDGSGGEDSSLGRRARSALASFIGARSDEQIDRLMGAGPGLKLIFKGMENAFVPEKARGFSGEILYELRGSRGLRSWTLRIDGDEARAEERAASEPAVTLRAELPVFVRIAAGSLDPAKAMLEGNLVIEGDFAVAGRLGEMFGADPR
jgi:putative sterol carrier protein